MRRVIFMCLDAGIATLILLPILMTLDKRYFHNRTRTIWYLILAVYLSGVYAVVGLPDIRYMRLDLHFNFKPFAYMFSDYKSTSLNVLLFAPLGFFLPVMWYKFRKWYWTVLFGLCMSLLIEVLQIFTLRATDVNDLMTNTFGTLIGWCLGRLVLKFIPGIDPEDNVWNLYAVCGVSFGVMFFLQPFLADALLYLYY